MPWPTRYSLLTRLSLSLSLAGCCSLQRAKKKRQQTQVIGKSLGEELAAEDEGVLAWVMKHKVGAVGDNSASSAKQKERELAKRTARMLDDTDKLLEEDEGPQGRQPAAKKRRSSGRSGAPVPAVIAHRPEDLQEGEIVMVLKDASVLAGANDLNEGARPWLGLAC